MSLRYQYFSMCNSDILLIVTISFYVERYIDVRNITVFNWIFCNLMKEIRFHIIAINGPSFYNLLSYIPFIRLRNRLYPYSVSST